MTPPLASVAANDLAVLSLFAGVFVSIALAVLIAVRAFRGYRRTRSRRLLALSVGLLLIVAVPKVSNLVLASATDLAAGPISTLTAGFRVTGLAIILATIYARS